MITDAQEAALAARRAQTAQDVPTAFREIANQLAALRLVE